MTQIDPRHILACLKCGSLIDYGKPNIAGGSHLAHWCPACSPQRPWLRGVVILRCARAEEIRRLTEMTAEELIEASSLGTPEAKAARARAPQEVVDAALARADELADDTLHVLPDHLLWRHFDDDDWNGSTAASYIHATTAKFVRLVAPADASPELVERIKAAFERQGAEVTARRKLDDSCLDEDQAVANLKQERRTLFWDAVHAYCRACGGDPSRHVYGNEGRQRAVVAMERFVFPEDSLDEAFAPQEKKQAGPLRFYPDVIALVKAAAEPKVFSKPGERIISNVTYCVPARGGSLTTERVEAGWLVGLDCARQCELRSPRNLHFAGVNQIEHECARENERLVVPPHPEECPALLKTEPM